ncbi:hypothetical protein BGX34_001166 [Mortierella sp. NVP85]|nr:hypothetical protein BGX34_001166 [Mortierella sp. NVP85]
MASKEYYCFYLSPRGAMIAICVFSFGLALLDSWRLATSVTTISYVTNAIAAVCSLTLCFYGRAAIISGTPKLLNRFFTLWWVLTTIASLAMLIDLLLLIKKDVIQNQCTKQMGDSACGNRASLIFGLQLGIRVVLMPPGAVTIRQYTLHMDSTSTRRLREDESGIVSGHIINPIP